MAEILSGGLNWGSTQQAIVTMDKEGHPLTCCNPVTGECLGGGGSSDFSTAEVTINNLLKSANNTLVPLTVFVPVDADNFIVGSVSLLTENSTHNVIIGESKAAMLVIDAEGVTVETTGSATYIPMENVVTIEGDCTITIKKEDSN